MGADGVVIRHHASGAPLTLATSGWIDAGVVNAGDGTHEHPTQALLDAFTIRRRLHGAALARTRPRRRARRDRRRHPALARRPVERLAAHDARREVDLVAPPTLRAGRHVGAGRRASATTSTRRSPTAPDVVMMLRIQAERMHAAFFPNSREYARTWGLDDDRFDRLPADYDGHAPRADEPRAGDRRPRRRFAAVHGARAGRERSISENGRPLSAAVGRTG